MLRAVSATCLARLSLAGALVSDVNTMTLHLLQPGEGGNACLDGSPFGYYIAQNASSNDWIIDIDGGGWCDSAQSCVSRISASSRLASSSTWAPLGGGSGITSGSPEDNPQYHTYNRVNFPYCDGSSFTSHREQPLVLSLSLSLSLSLTLSLSMSHSLTISMSHYEIVILFDFL